MTLRARAWILTAVFTPLLYYTLADTHFWSTIWMMLGLLVTAFTVAGVVVFLLSFLYGGDR